MPVFNRVITSVSRVLTLWDVTSADHEESGESLGSGASLRCASALVRDRDPSAERSGLVMIFTLQNLLTVSYYLPLAEPCLFRPNVQ